MIQQSIAFGVQTLHCISRGGLAVQRTQLPILSGNQQTLALQIGAMLPERPASRATEAV